MMNSSMTIVASLQSSQQISAKKLLMKVAFFCSPMGGRFSRPKREVFSGTKIYLI